MNGSNSSNFLTTDYQKFIHMSKYSRFNWDKLRRETWDETVDRWADFFKKTCKSIENIADREAAIKAIETSAQGIRELEVMPSMRTMMTAGPALEKNHLAAYNCSYVAVNRVQSFDEILYILACGTGVGFSVERQHINQLPTVAEDFHKSDIVIKVQDSKEGWAKSLKELVSLLYQGQTPGWDTSLVRGRGAPLITFGGRASGPEPLEKLFQFVVKLFQNAAGRKLTSLECHDFVCKIADAIVSGGVRRSALISLSNLSDDRMRAAKAGDWYSLHKHRMMANNSAVYTEKPDVGLFMQEWKSLYDSKSGERGIFNRESAKKKCEEIGRDSEHDFGTNPCVAGFSVLTVEVDGEIQETTIKELGPLIENHHVRVLSRNLASGTDEFKDVKAWCLTRDLAKVVKVTDDNGNSVIVTPDHLMYTTNRGYVAAIELTETDQVIVKK